LSHPSHWFHAAYGLKLADRWERVNAGTAVPMEQGIPAYPREPNGNLQSVHLEVLKTK